MTSRRSSGSRRAASSVEPTRSQNMRVSCRRSGACDRRHGSVGDSGLVSASADRGAGYGLAENLYPIPGTVRISLGRPGSRSIFRRSRPTRTSMRPTRTSMRPQQLRAEFVRAEMEKDRGELSALEDEVMKSLREGQIVADDVNREFDRGLTLGERTADKVAE